GGVAQRRYEQKRFRIHRRSQCQGRRLGTAPQNQGPLAQRHSISAQGQRTTSARLRGIFARRGSFFFSQRGLPLHEVCKGSEPEGPEQPQLLVSAECDIGRGVLSENATECRDSPSRP